MDLFKFRNEMQSLDMSFDFNGLLVDIKWVEIVPNNTKWEFKRHVHSSFEFHIIAKGKCDVIAGDKKFTAKAGELYIVPPGVYHSQISDADDIAIEYGINCDFVLDAKSILNKPSEVEMLLQLANNSSVVVLQDKYNITNLFENIILEFENKSIGYDSNIKLYIYQIILYSARALASHERFNSLNNKLDIDMLRMKRIEEFLEDNISSNLTLADISKILYLSEKQISRIVQKVKGKTFHQYMLDVKIQKSKDMILNSLLKINEVSDTLGFSNSNHFSNTFKQRVGISPLEYKNTNKT